MNWVIRQGSGWLQGPQGNNIFIQLEWMDSGRGWNPTSSGDNTTEYGVRTSIDTNGLGCLLLCLIGMIPETRECIIILRYADSNLTMTAYVIQDRRRGQKTDGQWL